MNLFDFKEGGIFVMAALDHRRSLIKMLGSGGKREVLEWKKEALAGLAGMASGVLVDFEYGLPAYQELGLKKPFWLAMEASGWAGTENNRRTRLQHLAREIKGAGAGGAKLLVYYNPAARAAAGVRAIIKRAAQDCRREGIPFLLEVVTYGTGKGAGRARAIINSVREIKKAAGEIVEVWKLEFPGDVKTATGRKKAAEECQKITEELDGKPWILLSAGEDFNVFKRQVEVAAANGASGFLAGRALWKDFGKYKNREKFFTGIARRRFEQIKKIAIENKRGSFDVSGRSSWWKELWR